MMRLLHSEGSLNARILQGDDLTVDTIHGLTLVENAMPVIQDRFTRFQYIIV